MVKSKKAERSDTMEFTITGRNMEVTESLKAAVQEKLGKLDRFFSQDTVAHVTLSVEKSRQIIEVTIPVKGGIIRAEQSNSDMYASIDLVEESIETQLKRYKNKLIDRYQDKKNFSKEFIEEKVDEEEEIRIVKTKRFDFKPMDPEEACMQMELLGHSFFVFTNAETDQINVVYKRKNNTYGLIEPEF